MASTQVNLYEAKTQLSSLVERAAKGEDIVIAKAGKPLARLTSLGGARSGPAARGAEYLSRVWQERARHHVYRRRL